jgi:hypothetical protein
MVTNFPQLPAELRTRIYEFALLPRHPICLRDKYFPVETPACALLRVNRMVHSEASAIFYSQNEFEITSCGSFIRGCSIYTPDQADSFFSLLGRNKFLIRKVNLQFPTLVVTEEANNFFLLAEHSRFLEVVQRHCTNLRTLKLHFPGTMLEYLGSGRDRWDLQPTFSIPLDVCCSKALSTVHARLKLFPSSPEVVVNLGRELDTLTHGLMVGHGWKIQYGTPTNHWHSPAHDQENDHEFQSIDPTWRRLSTNGHDNHFIVDWEM